MCCIARLDVDIKVVVERERNMLPTDLIQSDSFWQILDGSAELLTGCLVIILLPGNYNKS